MINKERKKFGLRPGRKPVKAQERLLACTASVHGPEQSGYCYIGFDPDFVSFVAKELPRGLAAYDPAFIEVSHLGDAWAVDAVYHYDGVRVTLWRTPEIPGWIGKLRKEKGNDSNPSPEGV